MISLQGITKRFSGHTVFQDIDLSLAQARSL